LEGEGSPGTEKEGVEEGTCSLLESKISLSLEGEGRVRV
jgi:hypothetical protein